MKSEEKLKTLTREMRPELNEGEYVFVSLKSLENIPYDALIGYFKEKEGSTIILERSKADELNLQYDYVASWITLTVHSSLKAVGFTAVFSTELAKHGISCNVIAGFYHDHIFVALKDGENALGILTELAQQS